MIGVAFASGHVLTFRRFRAAADGPGITSVWVHHPMRGWTVLTDDPRDSGAGRCFGGDGVRLESVRIEAAWSDGSSLTVRVPEAGLAWVVHTASTSWALRGVSELGRRLRLWKVPLARHCLAWAAGELLGCDALSLEGLTPSGVRFEMVPEELRSVPRSVALLDGGHLGPQVMLDRRPALGGYRMPRWGVFMTGTERFGR